MNPDTMSDRELIEILREEIKFWQNEVIVLNQKVEKLESRLYNK